MELNKELLAKAKDVKSPEELLALAKENGIEMTDESAKTYFKQLSTSSGEIADDELENASGGASSQIPGLACPHCGKFIPKTITELLTQGHLRCPYCLSILKID